MTQNAIDPHFRVKVVAQTSNPQQLIWLSAHQCVCEEAAIDGGFPAEDKSGEYAIKHLLAGGRGHYSPFEAPQISFNVIGFPHSVMQQIRTHRIGVHFSVQSFRYTGKRLYDVGIVMSPDEYIPGVWSYSDRIKAQVEEVVYLRPEGAYTDRQGSRYDYTEQGRLNDLALAAHCLAHYARNIERGYSEEHARSVIPFDVRQHWVMSVNVRSLMHLLDLRAKKDAQLECQQLCELILPHFEAWVPEIAAWYKENRLGKARLSP